MLKYIPHRHYIRLTLCVAVRNQCMGPSIAFWASFGVLLACCKLQALASILCLCCGIASRRCRSAWQLVLRRVGAPGVTHVVLPFGPDGDPDDGQEYMRTLRRECAPLALLSPIAAQPRKTQRRMREERHLLQEGVHQDRIAQGYPCMFTAWLLLARLSTDVMLVTLRRLQGRGGARALLVHAGQLRQDPAGGRGAGEAGAGQAHPRCALNCRHCQCVVSESFCQCYLSRELLIHQAPLSSNEWCC